MNRRPDPVEAAIAGELRLLDPAVRSSADRIAQLLHPEFTEIGASGRLYTRPEIIAQLVEEEFRCEIRQLRMQGEALFRSDEHGQTEHCGNALAGSELAARGNQRVAAGQHHRIAPAFHRVG